MGWSYNTNNVTCSPVRPSDGLGYRYNTDHVTCCPVCMCGLGGVGLQHRPCDMLSSMSVGLEWGGVTTHHVMCCPVICRCI